MTNSVEPIEPDEAREALAVATSAERAGRSRGSWSRPVGAVIAGVAGGFIAMPAFENVALVLVVLTVVLGVVVNHERQRLGAWPRDPIEGRVKSAVVAGASIAFFVTLTAGGVALQKSAGLQWAPVATGALGAAVLFLALERARRGASFAVRAEPAR